MTIISIDNASFCPGASVAAEVADRLGVPLVDEDTILGDVAGKSGIPPTEVTRLVRGPEKLIGWSEEDRPRTAALIRVAIARLLDRAGLVLHGRLGYLIPSAVTHVLRVGIVGSRARREERAASEGHSSRKAGQLIKQDDGSRARWVDLVLGADPWDKRLFDMILPSDQQTEEQLVAQIVENAAKPAVAATPESIAALVTFRQSALLQLEFAERGHDVDIELADGVATVLIKQHTMFLERLQQQLVEIACGLPGVHEAVARPGPRYREANLYLDVRSELPAKVLLVDDERSFVQTLSSRLRTRKIESTIANDGAEALSQVAQEEPDVMVLDLKMPGIDGLEVLRNVKSTNPRTQVIILTAHGSEAEERLAFQLGAFAYLRKPVDIDELTETMRLAYRELGEEEPRD